MNFYWNRFKMKNDLSKNRIFGMDPVPQLWNPKLWIWMDSIRRLQIVKEKNIGKIYIRSRNFCSFLYWDERKESNSKSSKELLTGSRKPKCYESGTWRKVRHSKPTQNKELQNCSQALSFIRITTWSVKRCLPEIDVLFLDGLSDTVSVQHEQRLAHVVIRVPLCNTTEGCVT